MSRAAFYQSNLNSLEVELAEARSKIFQDKRVYFSRTVVLRYRIHLEQKNLAPSTINVRLAPVRRLAYESRRQWLSQSRIGCRDSQSQGSETTRCANRELAHTLL